MVTKSKNNVKYMLKMKYFPKNLIFFVKKCYT